MNDIFKDLGFDDAQSDELHLRYELLEALLAIVKKHKYTQAELGKVLGQKQPHISNLLNGKIANFTSDRLASFLRKLGAKVKVGVTMPKVKKVA